METLTQQYFIDAQKKLTTIPRVSGIPIIFSDYACDPEYEMVKRTWKERLFTRPWNPRRKYKQIMTALNPQMFRINTVNGETIVAHISFKSELENLIATG